MLPRGDQLRQTVDLAGFVCLNYFLDFAVHQDGKFIVLNENAAAFLVDPLDNFIGVVPHLVSMMDMQKQCCRHGNDGRPDEPLINVIQSVFGLPNAYWSLFFAIEEVKIRCSEGLFRRDGLAMVRDLFFIPVDKTSFVWLRVLEGLWIVNVTIFRFTLHPVHFIHLFAVKHRVDLF